MKPFSREKLTAAVNFYENLENEYQYLGKDKARTDRVSDACRVTLDQFIDDLDLKLDYFIKLTYVKPTLLATVMMHFVELGRNLLNRPGDIDTVDVTSAICQAIAIETSLELHIDPKDDPVTSMLSAHCEDEWFSDVTCHLLSTQACYTETLPFRVDGRMNTFSPSGHQPTLQ